MEIINRDQLKRKIEVGVKLWNEDPIEVDVAQVLLDLDRELNEYLKLHPYDTEMWIKLAFINQTPPIAAYEDACDALYHILAYDPNNISVLLAIAQIEDDNGTTEQKTYNYLSSAKTEKPEELALIRFMQALYKRPTKSWDKYLRFLEESIELYSGFVWPHFKLAEEYERRGYRDKSCKHYKMALKNIKDVEKDGEFLDILSIDEFIDERIKGIKPSQLNFYMIESYVKSCEQSIKPSNLDLSS